MACVGVIAVVAVSGAASPVAAVMASRLGDGDAAGEAASAEAAAAWKAPINLEDMRPYIVDFPAAGPSFKHQVGRCSLTPC